MNDVLIIRKTCNFYYIKNKTISDRKCMSVIVKNDKGEIWLYTKGAESSIVPKCDAGPSNQTLEHVMDFALVAIYNFIYTTKPLYNFIIQKLHELLHSPFPNSWG